MNNLAVRKKISKRSIAAVAKTSGQPFESEIIDIKTNKDVFTNLNFKNCFSEYLT